MGKSGEEQLKTQKKTEQKNGKFQFEQAKNFFKNLY